MKNTGEKRLREAANATVTHSKNNFQGYMVNLSDVNAKSTLSRGDQCYPEKGGHFLLRLLTKMLKYCRQSREVSQKCVSKYSCGEKQEQKCLFNFPVHLRYKYYYYFTQYKEVVSHLLNGPIRPLVSQNLSAWSPFFCPL